jgi:hypothetical protein
MHLILTEEICTKYELRLNLLAIIHSQYTTYISRVGILFQGPTRAVAFDGNEHGETRKKGEPNLER